MFVSDSPVHIDLFSCIGGFGLAAERAGFHTALHCEVDPFRQAVLRKNWPDVPIVEDVRLVTAILVQRLLGHLRIALITGGFPCQGISGANPAGLGLADERSGLWFEFLRIIGEVQPLFVIIENSPNLRTRGADTVLSGLEEAGYTAEPFVVGAWAAGAKHQRDRVFVVAHLAGWEGRGRVLRRDREFSTPHETAGRGRHHGGGTTLLQRGQRREDEPGVVRTLHGVPRKVDRLTALGNAVVPDVVQPFLDAIYEAVTRAAE